MKTKTETNLQVSHVKAYNFIQKYITKNIVSPEISEISKGIAMTLRHTYRVVGDLVVNGYLSRDSHKKRSIKILKPMK